MLIKTIYNRLDYVQYLQNNIKRNYRIYRGDDIQHPSRGAKLRRPLDRAALDEPVHSSENIKQIDIKYNSQTVL